MALTRAKAPPDATYVEVCYGITRYWKAAEDGRNSLTGELRVCWAYWEGRWVKDKAACSRHFKRIEKDTPK